MKFRVLIYLGLNPTKTTIQQIADRYGISKNHLTRIVQRLGQGGFIETLRVAQAASVWLASLMTLTRKLVRVTEENLNIVECFDK